jgi:hypothetical protein
MARESGLQIGKCIGTEYSMLLVTRKSVTCLHKASSKVLIAVDDVVARLAHRMVWPLRDI